MLDKRSFAQIRKSFEAFEKRREESIQKSRIIIQLSKKIIYSLHRNDMKGATDGIKEIKSKLKGLEKKAYDTEMNSVAQQEYVEALAFYEFIKSGKIPNYNELGVSPYIYLLGLCDLTGELGRKAVNEAIRKNYKLVFIIKELVDEIYGEFLKLDLRNSELRKKSDGIKWNLKKLEDLVFSIKLKERPSK